MTTSPSKEVTTGVKGLAFLSVMRSFATLYGEQVRERALVLLNPELRDAFASGTLAASSWYPVAWYRDLWKALRTTSGAGPELARQIGRESFRSDLNFVYRAVLNLVSPQTVVSVGMRFFSRYYSGVRSKFESRAGFAHGRFEGCRDWDENMWGDVQGAIEIMIESAGAKEVVVSLLAGGREGDDFTELEARWK